MLFPSIVNPTKFSSLAMAAAFTLLPLTTVAKEAESAKPQANEAAPGIRIVKAAQSASKVEGNAPAATAQASASQASAAAKPTASEASAQVAKPASGASAASKAAAQPAAVSPATPKAAASQTASSAPAAVPSAPKATTSQPAQAAASAQSAPAVSGTPCEEVKAMIAAKLDAKGMKGYTLTAVAKEEVKEAKVVGSCEGGSKKIAYQR
jgi:hypothetical protein